jgi:hypothetical protein
MSCLRFTEESKIEKTYLLCRQILAPGGSPAGLDRTRRKFSPDGGRRNLSPPSIPASECGGGAFSPGKSSPAGPLSFLGLSRGGLISRLFQNSKGVPCLFYFGLIYNLHNFRLIPEAGGQPAGLAKMGRRFLRGPRGHWDSEFVHDFMPRVLDLFIRVDGP